MGKHQLSARSYSPTALQNFAACPYRFFLQAVHRLEPREEPEAIETLDPLTRGGLFAEVQYEILSALRELDVLPVTPEDLDDASGLLDEKLDEVAARWHEELAPAIERVWLDGIEGIRADLREWMRRAADDPEHWRPEWFELGFGLSDRAQADPHSSADPVAIEGGLSLRGSIDLLERDPAGRIRVTDHKTGKVRAEKNFVIGGGKTLQPVLYALAAEQRAARENLRRTALLLHRGRRLRGACRRDQRRGARARRAISSRSSRSRSKRDFCRPRRTIANATGATTSACAARTRSGARKSNRKRGSSR